MSVFVDTSALYAVLDADDAEHERAGRQFADLLDGAVSISTHNCVLIETTALVQRRLGMTAVRVLVDDIMPVLAVTWIDEQTHRAACTALTSASNRHVSLVDWVSFTIMRRAGIDTAFAFDDDFDQQGFWTVP